MRNKPKTTEKIYWRSIPKYGKVIILAGAYYYQGEMVYWMGGEADAARSFLNRKLIGAK